MHVYWFSGTGNSLAAARVLASAQDETTPIQKFNIEA